MPSESIFHWILSSHLPQNLACYRRPLLENWSIEIIKKSNRPDQKLMEHLNHVGENSVPQFTTGLQSVAMFVLKEYLELTELGFRSRPWKSEEIHLSKGEGLIRFNLRNNTRRWLSNGIRSVPPQKSASIMSLSIARKFAKELNRFRFARASLSSTWFSRSSFGSQFHALKGIELRSSLPSTHPQSEIGSRCWMIVRIFLWDMGGSEVPGKESSGRSKNGVIPAGTHRLLNQTQYPGCSRYSAAADFMRNRIRTPSMEDGYQLFNTPDVLKKYRKESSHFLSMTIGPFRWIMNTKYEPPWRGSGWLWSQNIIC
jgi:hypothetical protein